MGLAQPRGPTLQIRISGKPRAMQTHHQRQSNFRIIGRRHEQPVGESLAANPNRLPRKHAHRSRLVNPAFSKDLAHSLNAHLGMHQNRLQRRFGPFTIVYREILFEKRCQGLTGRIWLRNRRTGLRVLSPCIDTNGQAPNSQ